MTTPARVLVLLAPLLTSPVHAQKFDTLSTDQSGVEVVIEPIHHASLLLQFKGKVIYVDPAGPGDYASLPKADYIFLTDIHGDHLDKNRIEALKKDGTVIVAPQAVAAQVNGAVVIQNGETKSFGEIGVEAVPMYNMQRGPSPGQFYHTKGRGNGYVLTMAGKRFYISGDTEAIPEMQALKNIDAAFVCMNLPYTMTPEEAAAAVKAFRPKIVYPYHYQGSDVKAFAAALAGEKGIEVRLRNWY